MSEPKIYYINVESPDWKINPNIPLHVKRKNFYTKEQIFFSVSMGCQAVNRLGDNNKLPRSFRAIQNYDSSWNKSYFDVCTETAENLWKLDKPIKVAWSGGIDSTIVAVAMLLTKPDSASLNFIYTNHSIEEYPLFYEKYIKSYDKPVERKEIFSLLNSYTDSIIVTGEAGDQTFGSDWVLNMSMEENFQPWENILSWDEEKWNSKRKFNSQGEVLVNKFAVNLSGLGTKAEREETLYNFIKKCPVLNPTINDYFWWASFVNKYDWVTKRLHILHAQSPDVGKKFKSFFDNSEMDMWSMSYRAKGVRLKKIEDYKRTGKEFIYNFTKDADYRDNKIKAKSLPNISDETDAIRHPNSLKLILNDGRFWRNKDSFSGKDVEMLRKLLA